MKVYVRWLFGCDVIQAMKKRIKESHYVMKYINGYPLIKREIKLRYFKDREKVIKTESQSMGG